MKQVIVPACPLELVRAMTKKFALTFPFALFALNANPAPATTVDVLRGTSVIGQK